MANKPRSKVDQKEHLYLRPVKRKCMVKGCPNTDCTAVSRNPEFGNTVILCGACIRDLCAQKGEEETDGASI